MLRKVLWIAAACAAILVALAVSRSLNFDRPAPRKALEAPAAVDVAAPAAEVAPEAPPPPVVAAKPPPPTPEETQVQEDAAATGMTTLEPQEAPSEPQREPPREEPPT
jgi:outer membrane biosynthesis protein TonB